MDKKRCSTLLYCMYVNQTTRPNALSSITKIIKSPWTIPNYPIALRVYIAYPSHPIP